METNILKNISVVTDKSQDLESRQFNKEELTSLCDDTAEVVILLDEIRQLADDASQFEDDNAFLRFMTIKTLAKFGLDKSLQISETMETKRYKVN